MARNVLLGFKRGNFDGRQYESMWLGSELKEKDYANGSAGMSVEKFYVPDDMIGILKPEDIGKELAMDFEVTNGKAHLLSFAVKPGGSIDAPANTAKK